MLGIVVAISSVIAIVIATKPVDSKDNKLDVSKDINPIENISFFSSSELKIPEGDIDNTDSTDNHAKFYLLIKILFIGLEKKMT